MEIILKLSRNTHLICSTEYVFLCQFYIYKYFGGILNSQAIKFPIISENKVLVNNSELIVSDEWIMKHE